MARGDDIHKQAEAFVKGTPYKGKVLRSVPADLKLFEDELKRLKKLYQQVSYSMVVEDNWAFRRDWSETAWNDWNECWLRVKLDLAYHEDDVTLVVVDWKSGKFRPEKHEEYVEQCELYALSAFLLHDHLERVKTLLRYTDLGLTYGLGETAGEGQPLVFTRADVPRLTKLWEKRVKPMLNDTIFAPKPNNLCCFCAFSKDKGGPCQF
jgi:hypothetical protein